jgi:pimeloyl-ACP methyl ester carboxylesterase
MIEDARGRLSERGWEVSPRVLIAGFSASGMFANRFTALHPGRVLAAAVGAPGGWPISPLERWQGRALPYPVGVADLGNLVDAEFDADAYRKIPHFFFMGTLDHNDSVVFRDGYRKQDEDLILDLFGVTPLERWDAAKRQYDIAGAAAEFRLYDGVGHEVSDIMSQDMGRFFTKVLAGNKSMHE